MKPAGKAGTLASLVIITTLGLPQAAQAATMISSAELDGSTVRIVGSGASPNTRILVNGGWLSGRSDAKGRFEIASSTFTVPSNCRVTVSDGRTSATSRLSGCTVSVLRARR
jgi:hypothetical protein